MMTLTYAARPTAMIYPIVSARACFLQHIPCRCCRPGINGVLGPYLLPDPSALLPVYYGTPSNRLMHSPMPPTEIDFLFTGARRGLVVRSVLIGRCVGTDKIMGAAHPLRSWAYIRPAPPWSMVREHERRAHGHFSSVNFTCIGSMF